MLKLKEIRKKRGMTLEELSKRINMSKGNISQIERGTVNITQDNIAKITDALNVSVSELFGERPVSQNQIINVKFVNDILIVKSYDDFNDVDTFTIDERFLFFLGLREKFKSLLVTKAPNNSMYPIIENGDVVFIDISERSINRDGFYLIEEQGILQIRKAILDKKEDRVSISTINKVVMGSVENNYKSDELKKIVYGRILFYTKNIF